MPLTLPLALRLRTSAKWPRSKAIKWFLASLAVLTVAVTISFALRPDSQSPDYLLAPLWVIAFTISVSALIGVCLATFWIMSFGRTEYETARPLATLFVFAIRGAAAAFAGASIGASLATLIPTASFANVFPSAAYYPAIFGGAMAVLFVTTAQWNRAAPWATDTDIRE
jgi:hypothetical protein